MAADYKLTPITGVKRTRAYSMIADNPLNQAPKVTFKEEEVMEINGVTSHVPCGGFMKEMTDPSIEFPLLDPTTETDTGMRVTLGQFYAMGYSLYLFLAVQRDAEVAAAAAAQPPIEPTPEPTPTPTETPPT